jgi:hypothetical protein
MYWTFNPPQAGSSIETENQGRYEEAESLLSTRPKLEAVSKPRASSFLSIKTYRNNFGKVPTMPANQQ